MQTLQNRIVQLPKVGSALMVNPPDMSRFPVTIDESWLAEYLEADLPPAPLMQFVPWYHLPSGLLGKTGNPFNRSYKAVVDKKGYLLSTDKVRTTAEGKTVGIEEYTYGVMCEMNADGTLNFGDYDLLAYVGGDKSFIYQDPQGNWVAADRSQEFNAERAVGINWGTPASVVVTTVEVDGLLCAVMYLQHRTLLIDPLNGLGSGQWTLQVPGGFGTRGKTAGQQAAAEAFEEQGVTFELGSEVYVGSFYNDRARDLTPVRSHVAPASIFGEPQLVDDEKKTINEVKILVPLECWIPGVDSVVENAMARAIRYHQIVPRYV